MNELQKEIREKRDILRNLYGGSMTGTDLMNELHCSRDKARIWAIENGIAFYPFGHIQPRYDTDKFAKVIVTMRYSC